MIIDARTIPVGTSLDCCTCVIGAGPAGITVALLLAEKGMNVVLVEAGGEQYSRRDQVRFFAGEVINPISQPGLDLYRIRQLGGTSNRWGGRCAPYEEIDFEKRHYVPFSGWPIDLSVLQRHYLRAHDVLDLGEFRYRLTERGEIGAESKLRPFPSARWKNVDDAAVWRFSLPTNFRKKYRAQLARSPNIKVLLHAPCLELLTSDDKGSISQAVIGTAPAQLLRIAARTFIIAAGGLESARLLLLSRGKHHRGLGNETDNVGRFYMTHLYGNVAKLRYMGDPRCVNFGFWKSGDGVYVRNMLKIDPDIQRERHLLNFCAVLGDPDVHDPHHRSGVLSTVFLIKALMKDRLPVELIGPNRSYGADVVRRHFQNVLSDAGGLLQFSYAWLRDRILADRKLPGIAMYSPSGEYHFMYSAEQEPSPNSRVTLSAERDDLGCNRLKSDWRYSDRDIDGIIANHVVVAEDVRMHGGARLQFDLDLSTARERVTESMGVGSHHMGTTRMASQPSAGVVDGRCRVHGLANLYIASSSVFSTASCMSPTLTVLALASYIAETILRLEKQGPNMMHAKS